MYLNIDRQNSQIRGNITLVRLLHKVIELQTDANLPLLTNRNASYNPVFLNPRLSLMIHTPLTIYCSDHPLDFDQTSMAMRLGEIQSREVRERLTKGFHYLFVISLIAAEKPKAYKSTQMRSR